MFKIFCEILKKLRKSKGVTQKLICEETGITERHYQSMEYGKTKPGLDVLVILANYFDVSVDYLSGRKTEEKPRVAAKNSISDSELNTVVNGGRNVNVGHRISDSGGTQESLVMLAARLMDSIRDKSALDDYEFTTLKSMFETGLKMLPQKKDKG